MWQPNALQPALRARRRGFLRSLVELHLWPEPPSTFRAEDIWGGLSVPMLVTAIDQWNSWQRAPLPGQGTDLDMELVQE
jgi:hypothetical protein